MSDRALQGVVDHVRKMTRLPGDQEASDARLLESFLSCHDERAFAILMDRHAHMVMGVCSRVLHNHHDAEDAFQATFLILARKAGSIQPPHQLANWLHGVAYRTALKCRATCKKQTRRLLNVQSIHEPLAANENPARELAEVIDKHIRCLPDRYRLPVILCDLQGYSITEATQRLGWPQGTLAGRLARARKLLARRLGQNTLGFCVLLDRLFRLPTMPMSPALFESTLRAGLDFSDGTPATLLSSIRVATLVKRTPWGTSSMPLRIAIGILLACNLAIAFTCAYPKDSTNQNEIVPPSPKAVQIKKTKDEALLQGEWRVVRMEDGGVRLPKKRYWDDLKVSGNQFSSGKKSVESTWKNPTWNYRFKLDPSKNPKEITFENENPHAWPEPQTMVGIYELNSNDLRICIPIGTVDPGPIPKSFHELDPTYDNTLLVFERITSAQTKNVDRAGSVSAAGNPSFDLKSITNKAEQYDLALLKKSPDKLAPVLHKDYQLHFYYGREFNKEEVIAYLFAPRRTIARFKRDRVHFKTFGNTVIETGTLLMLFGDPAHYDERDTEYSRVWMNVGNDWQIVHEHFN